MIFTLFVKGWQLDKMFEKHHKFFDGNFVASDLRKCATKNEKSKVSVTIVKNENKPEIEKQLDFVLESLVASGQKEKAYLIQQIYEKNTDFSVDIINKINGKDLSNEMSATADAPALPRLDPSKDQYHTIRK